MQEYLIKRQIKWEFNLSRAQWRGRQFERMVGLVKQSLVKATGRTNQARARRNFAGRRNYGE